MNSVKIEIYKDVKRQYRWRLRAGNGEIVAQGESYITRTGAQKAVQRLKLLFTIGTIVDIY